LVEKRGFNLSQSPGDRKKTSRVARIAVLVVGGIVAGSLVAHTLAAFPRGVDIDRGFSEPALAGRECRTIVSARDETVVEATEIVPDGPSPRLRETFRLAPGAHRLEVRVAGCRANVRAFDPGTTRRVTVEYHCAGR
jgi:hypothetical protein